MRRKENSLWIVQAVSLGIRTLASFWASICIGGKVEVGYLFTLRCRDLRLRGCGPRTLVVAVWCERMEDAGGLRFFRAL